MGSYFSISISATENSYSIENNTSNVTVSLWCNGNNGWADDNPSYWLKVNGNTVASGTYNFSYTSFTVCSWTGNVPHNADGTGSITYQGYYQGTDKPYGDTTAVYTLNLTTIPRASEILNGTTQRRIDETISFSVDKKNTNFVDKLTIYPTTKSSLTTVVSPYTTGSTFTIGTATFNSIKALAPTTSYTSMVVKVETFTSSGAVVGTASSQFRGTFNVTAPTISPTWSASPTEEVISGHNNVTISLGRSATPDIGTTISAYEFTIGTTTLTTTGYSIEAENIKSNDVSVKIIDRRGISTTVSTNDLFGIVEYNELQIISSSINRNPTLIDTGAIIRIEGTYTYFDFEENVIDALYTIGTSQSMEYMSTTYSSDGTFVCTATIPTNTFDAAQEYQINIQIKDNYSVINKQLTLSKASITLDMDLTNQRVGIGQPIPESLETLDSGSLIVGKDIYVGRNIIGLNNIQGNHVYSSGDIYENGIRLSDKYSGGSGGGGNNLVTLWTNPSPTSTFNGQTVNLLQDSSNFDMLIFVSSYSRNNGKRHTDIAIRGESNFTITTFQDSTTNTSSDTTLAWRNVSISGASVTINNAMYNAASVGNYDRNDVCIPLYIYGAVLRSSVFERAKTLLWTNSSPTSTFSPQTITLSQSALQFDALLVETQYSTQLGNRHLDYIGNSGRYNIIVPKTVTDTAAPYIVGWRDVVVNGTSIEFFRALAKNLTTGGPDNNIAIPLNIWGIKFGGTTGVPMPTEYTASGSTTTYNSISKSWTVQGSGFVFVSCYVTTDSTNTYGSTWANIEYDGAYVAMNKHRLNSNSADTLAASSSIMLYVEDGKTISCYCGSTEDGTKTAKFRAMAFGCTLT